MAQHSGIRSLFVCAIASAAFLSPAFEAMAAEIGIELVSDTNQSPVYRRSLPGPFVEVSDKVIFPAEDAFFGRELWSTDGTPDGTAILFDLEPGQESSNPSDFAVMGGVAFFRGTTNELGEELYRTDGTAEGTTLVIDLRPGALGSWPTDLTTCGSSVYFVAYTETTGVELWRTDGTTGGTELVDDLVPGAMDSDSEHLWNRLHRSLWVRYDAGLTGVGCDPEDDGFDDDTGDHEDPDYGDDSGDPDDGNDGDDTVSGGTGNDTARYYGWRIQPFVTSQILKGQHHEHHPVS